MTCISYLASILINMTGRRCIYATYTLGTAWSVTHPKEKHADCLTSLPLGLPRPKRKAHIPCHIPTLSHPSPSPSSPHWGSTQTVSPPSPSPPPPFSRVTSQAQGLRPQPPIFLTKMGADATYIAVSEASLTTDDEFLVLVGDIRFKPLPTTTSSGTPSITKCSRKMKEKGAAKGDEEIEVTIGHGELIGCAKKSRGFLKNCAGCCVNVKTCRQGSWSFGRASNSFYADCSEKTGLSENQLK